MCKKTVTGITDPKSIQGQLQHYENCTSTYRKEVYHHLKTPSRLHCHLKNSQISENLLHYKPMTFVYHQFPRLHRSNDHTIKSKEPSTLQETHTIIGELIFSQTTRRNPRFLFGWIITSNFTITQPNLLIQLISFQIALNVHTQPSQLKLKLENFEINSNGKNWRSSTLIPS